MKHYKKGVLILALTGVVLGLYGCGTDTGKATGETGTVTIGDADSLYIREEASTDADVLSMLPDGETVTITGEENDFYKVTVQNTDGTTTEGYVKKEYITLAE